MSDIPMSNTGNIRTAGRAKGVAAVLPWSVHWRLAWRQWWGNGARLGVSFIFVFLLFFLSSIVENANSLQIGVILLYGVSLGLVPQSVAWEKSQLRALGFSTADIRRNYGIIMPLTAVLIAAVLLVTKLVLAAFGGSEPGKVDHLFDYVLVIVLVTNVLGIGLSFSRLGKDSEVIKAGLMKQSDEDAPEDRSDPAGAPGSANTPGRLVTKFDRAARWQRAEKLGSSPSARDYLVSWRIDTYMAWVLSALFVVMTVGIVCWFATGLTSSGAMWLYPAVMIVLLSAYYLGDSLNSGLCNWLIFSGDRYSWYAVAIRRTTAWLPVVGVVVLLGVGEFALLRWLFPDVGDREVVTPASGQAVGVALMLAVGAAVVYELIAILSLWVTNRFTGWVQWVVVIVTIMALSGALAATAAFLEGWLEDGSSAVLLLGSFVGVAIALLGITLLALRAGIQRFDTAYESTRENLGLTAEA